MLHYYPAVPLSWASEVAPLTLSEVSYGVAEGFLTPAEEQTELAKSVLSLAAIGGDELAIARDVLFRLLLINLHKRWFCFLRPLRALEYLVVDFEDCPTANIGDGHLPSSIAGISETENRPELDPDYFARKVKTFQFLTGYVTEIVRAGVRSQS
jgi:hypothetical protein